jgi:hypothetical protein
VIDTGQLLRWLKGKAEHRNPVIGAVYAGLASRVEAGQFDEKETDGG